MKVFDIQTLMLSFQCGALGSSFLPSLRQACLLQIHKPRHCHSSAKRNDILGQSVWTRYSEKKSPIMCVAYPGKLFRNGGNVHWQAEGLA